MSRFFIKTPWWLKKIYPNRIWDMPSVEKSLYLTFDDGPHPIATTFVLDELKKYNAKATFFCIGKNVVTYPAIYQRILDEGHRVGNHTQNHLNGWKTNDIIYLNDVSEATKIIESNLFRPPYGRLRSKQAKKIPMAMDNKSVKIVMWDVLSGDFDESISKERCLENVKRKSEAGSIIVFHDSEKAFPRLEFVLPQILRLFSKEEYVFMPLE